MMCLRHLLVYSVLLPIPAASPLFLALFAAAVFWTERPCGYCLALFSILFLATSPSSPFIHPPAPPDPSTVTPSTPLPGRTWLNLNSGRVCDPALAGYQPSYESNETDVDPDITTFTPTVDGNGGAGGLEDGSLPENYMDWSYKGLGMIIDFGWKRTDEGIMWEKSQDSTRRRQSQDSEPEAHRTADSPGWRRFLGDFPTSLRRNLAPWS